MPKIAGTTHRRSGGVLVKSIQAESMAEACDIEPGDTIFSINGNVIPDSLSFTFNIASPDLVMAIDKPDGERWEVEIENDPSTAFGVELEEDSIMLCRNKCIFCFVDQNPKGYRRSLLIKDEDIRLSFMYGNYSTLSSTDEAEEARIIREKITPLYVSVHATDPVTRVFMLKNKKTGNILERLKMFAGNGIEFHAQIVLCPEINDGEILDRTFRELGGLFPACKSIAVVPLGITKHRQGLTSLEPVTDDYCRQTIEFCRPYRARFQAELGYPLIFLGDEFFIRARQPIPAMDHYRDFPQMENGIGMVRRFIDEFEDGLDEAEIPTGVHGTLVTGTLFGPVLHRLIERLNQKAGTRLKVAVISNNSFGPDLINVAGLVHGVDIIEQTKGTDLGDFLLLPHVMLKDPEEDRILVDNYSPSRISQALNVPVIGSGNSATELFEALSDWKAHRLEQESGAAPVRAAFAV